MSGQLTDKPQSFEDNPGGGMRKARMCWNTAVTIGIGTLLVMRDTICVSPDRLLTSPASMASTEVGPRQFFNRLLEVCRQSVQVFSFMPVVDCESNLTMQQPYVSRFTFSSDHNHRNTTSCRTTS